ncbi:hypothetical protein FNAPI_1397 [Fusarium napiforme]|uniref:C2H2-type domain-containing protein n=1 Tax=Fusarium napiforme TaxID=42672 RepID=A0A8H5K321_9HYPO|nr:hypothetical protein FNAPI_1397 [Fusarium napiforme]
MTVPSGPGAIPSMSSPREWRDWYQNRDINSSEYGGIPNLMQEWYPLNSTFRPPPFDSRDDYRNGPRSSHGLRQGDPDSIKAYTAPGKSLLEPTSSLYDKQARHFSYQDEKTFSDTDSSVSMNSEPTLNDHELSETLKSLIRTLHGRELQALQLRQRPELQDKDKKSRNVGQSFIDDVKTKFKNPPEVFKESIELPDPGRLSIRSPDLPSSPTVSSDIDVDSVSGDSEAHLDRKGKGHYFFNRVFCRLMILGQNEVAARGESSSNSSKGKQSAKGGSGSPSGKNNTASTIGGRKNRRQDEDHRDTSRDRQDEPPKKKGKTSQPHCDERSQFLACPYWKADSKKYWDCFLKKNDTIAHLKQHLTRRHTPKYYCQICYQTFREFDLFDSHALERSCTRGPSAKLEGISQQQKNKLSLKSKGSVEQQWYAVWSILFPGLEPPATIYIYSTQSEDFCRIQEFAQREGVAIMLDELESNGLVVRPDVSSQLLRSTVQRAMVSIFRSYSNGGEPSSEAEEPILNQVAEPDHGVSLQQDSNTEGRMGHGDHPTSCTDAHRMTEDERDSSMVGRLDRPSRSTCSQLPTTTSWPPREVLQDDTEDELWGTAFLDDTAFGESSSRWNLPLNLESSDMLDLDALLRDVISTEA